jgi:cytochrome c biogenesis protein CcmG/thiol:disulfide interchange protein DsbE
MPASKNPPNYPRGKPKPQKNTGMIVVITVAVVAVLGILGAVIATQVGGDESPATNSSGAALEQTRPVAIEGEALPPDSDAQADPAVGTVPPRLEGSSFDGTPVTIDPADGTPKLVMFFAHWCPHCQAEVPRVVSWINAGKVPAGVDVYGVSTSVAESRGNYPPSQWLADDGWTAPTIADSQESEAATAWGLQTFPYFVVVDKDGKVVARAHGELDENAFTQLVSLVAPPAG